MNRTIEDLAASFATSQGVEALVLAGSMTSGLADEGSDYDLHAYTREAVPLEFRARLLTAQQSATPAPCRKLCAAYLNQGLISSRFPRGTGRLAHRARRRRKGTDV